MAEYNPRILSNFYKNPTVNIVLKEAVTNSIHANASYIKIDLIYAINRDLIGKKDNTFLSKIKIIDNGDGFNDENISAFLEFATKHKESIGCKGLGRISFLNLASKVSVESIAMVDDKKKKVTFNFTPAINQNDIKTEEVNSSTANQTIIELSELKLKNPNTYLSSVYESLAKHLKLFIFLQSKEKKNNIIIEICRNGEVEETISSDTMNLISEEKITIKDIDFSIYMFINNKEKGILRALCADNLAVEKEIKNLNTTFYKQYFFAITSPILNSSSDNERDNILELQDGTPLKYYTNEIDKRILLKIQKEDSEFKEYNKKSIEKLKSLYGYYKFDNLEESDLSFDFEN